MTEAESSVTWRAHAFLGVQQHFPRPFLPEIIRSRDFLNINQTL
jgi:hypothetical protein